jgi:SagB-type dehydrogenase family enzyme
VIRDDHAPPRTVRTASIVYGALVPAADDLAELYHEASRAYPSVAARGRSGAVLLDRLPALRASAARAVRRCPQAAPVPLPPPTLPIAGFADVVARRRSCRAFADASLTAPQLSALLYAGYGVTHVPAGDTGAVGQTFRAVPSGGALYPLDLTVCAWAVDGLAPGAYHYDPLRHALERLPSSPSRTDVQDALVFPEVASTSAVLVVVSSTFWRSRFKYGLRGYRFALLEAGHVVQNVLLAAAALDLGAVPLGGFYDARLDAIVGVDGVDEATVYAVAVGIPVEPVG